MASKLEGSSSSLSNNQHYQDKSDTSEIVNGVNSSTSLDTSSVQVKLDGLQEDLSELIHILHATERSSVKEIIQTDIQLILSKTESLEDLSMNQLETNISWSKVATLKHNKIKYVKQKIPYPQYITSNRYTECNRRNGPDFGRVFLRSNYTDITQNTYIQS